MYNVYTCTLLGFHSNQVDVDGRVTRTFRANFPIALHDTGLFEIIHSDYSVFLWTG